MRPVVVGDNVRAVPAWHPVAPREGRWDLAFAAVLGYVVVEYTSLPQMFPVLWPLHLGILIVVLGVVGFLLSPRVSADIRSGSRIIEFLLVFFLLASFLSALQAVDQMSAWDGFSQTFRWVVIYFLISRIPNSTWRLRILIFIVLLLNLKLAQFSVRSYFGQLGFRGEEFLSQRGVSGGSTNFFGNPGDFGVAMCVVWPLAGSLLFGESKKVLRIFLVTCFVAFFAAILLCGSRGAVVGAAATALVAWAKNPRRIGGAVMVLVVAVGIYSFLPQANQNRLSAALHWQTDPTGNLRVHLWEAGLRMFAEHPLLGVGPRNYAYTLYESGVRPDPWVRQTYWQPHSIYIQALSEVGLLGTLPLPFLWISMARLNARTRKHLRTLDPHSHRTFEYRLSIGLDLALVGFLVSGAFLTVLLYPHLWILLGLTVALHNTCLRKKPERTEVKLETQERKFALAAV